MTTIAYGALWLFCFAVPWQNIIVIPGVGTISRLVGMLAFGVAVFAVVVSGRARRLQLFHVAALLFVVWAGLGVFRAADEPRAIQKFGTFFQLFLVLWMIWELAPGLQRLRGLLFAYVCGAYVAVINTIMVYRSLLGTNSRRFAAEGFDPNDLGMILALGLPMAWYLGMTSRRPLQRWLCLGYVPAGLVAIGLTASRGAMLASIVALLIVPVSMTRLTPGKIALAVLLVVGSGAAALTYIPETSWNRLATTGLETQHGTFNSRLTTWKLGMMAFSKKPVLGYGTSSFNWTVHAQPHNSYLSVLVELGIVGFLLCGLMFVAVFIKVLRLPSMERRFALVLLATLGVAMLPLGWETRKAVWLVLAILCALPEAVAGRATAVQPMPQRVYRRPMVLPRQPAPS